MLSPLCGNRRMATHTNHLIKSKRPGGRGVQSNRRGLKAAGPGGYRPITENKSAITHMLMAMAQVHIAKVR